MNQVELIACARDVFQYAERFCVMKNAGGGIQGITPQLVNLVPFDDGSVLMEIVVMDEGHRPHFRREVFPGLELTAETLIKSGRVNMECLIASLSTKH